MTRLDSAIAHHQMHDEGAGGANLNWLRAAVLGANDGIVSIASIVVGVAGAAGSSSAILVAGVAGVTAGALSMAMGEYVSVSAQRDTEQALLEKERRELLEMPEEELEELAMLYQAKGLSSETAHLVARELTAHDAFAAHVDIELNIDPNDLTNPWHAAIASAASFFAGAVIPLVVILLVPASVRVAATFVSVACALAITGALSAHAGRAGKLRAVARVVLGGMLAMVATYGIGVLFGVAGI